MPRKIPEWLSKEIVEKGGLKTIIKDIPSDSELEKISRIYAALSDPIRLKILCFLNSQRSCVCLIREIAKISYSKISYHLSILKKANLITGKKEHNYVIYNLTELGKKYAEEICKK